MSSMESHKQEVVGFLRENGYLGIVADSAEYCIFDPPRYVFDFGRVNYCHYYSKKLASPLASLFFLVKSKPILLYKILPKVFCLKLKISITS